MAQQVPFHVTSGLPFARTITVSLPAGRTWWTTGTSFEVLSQIREAKDFDSPLLLDLKQFITTTFTAPNTVTISIVMNGADTRKLKKSGYYDIIMSDLFLVDARAIAIISGSVFRDAVVTSDQQETV